MRDMVNNKQVVHLGNLTLSGTTPAVSSYVDLKGFDACTIVCISNTITDAGTASGYTATLQESADTTAAAAATVATGEEVNADVDIAEVTDGNDDTIMAVFGYLGDARYVGISAVGTTNTDADVTVIAILNKPHRAPTTSIGTAVART